MYSPLWNAIKACWKDLTLRISLSLMLVAGVPIWWFHKADGKGVAGAWGPSIACNLFTTGLAIYCINSLLARKDEQHRRLAAAVTLVPSITELLFYADSTADILLSATSNTDENRNSLLDVWQVAETSMIRNVSYVQALVDDLTRIALHNLESHVRTMARLEPKNWDLRDGGTRIALSQVAGALDLVAFRLFNVVSPDTVTQAAALRTKVATIPQPTLAEVKSWTHQ